MPALSCLCCSACFLDAVGPRGWRDGCGAQVARCIGAGTALRVSDGEAREQGAKAVRPCRVPQAAGRGGHKRDGRGARGQAGQARAAGRKARSAGLHAAAAERPGGAGNIFAPCVISGSSTRKRALGGKIRAPCIPNRPIAPGNGCMGRGCCHLDLEEHAFRADVARKGAFFAHSAKKGCIRCGSCQSGPWGRRNARREMGRDADVGARWARCGWRSATRIRRRR